MDELMVVRRDNSENARIICGRMKNEQKILCPTLYLFHMTSFQIPKLKHGLNSLLFLISWADKKTRKEQESQKRITKIMTLVFMTYYTSYIPRFIALSITSNYRGKEILSHVTFAIFMVNSVLNPWIYSWNSPHFKMAYHRIFGVINNNDSSMSTKLSRTKPINSTSGRLE